MGARGPLPAQLPPNVAALKRKAGTVRSESGAKAPVNRPEPPGEFTPAELAWWEKTVADLEPIGLLASSDAGLLAAWCRAAAAADELWAEIRSTGYVVASSHGGQAKNPRWQMWRDAISKMESVGKSLGLSPESRLRMPPVPEDDDEDDLD